MNVIVYLCIIIKKEIMKKLVLVCGFENEKIESFVRKIDITKGDVNVVLYPENSMHPRYQIEKLKELINCNGDLVIATHSEIIFNQIRIEIKSGVLTTERVTMFFVHTDKFPEIVKIRTDGSVANWIVGLFDGTDNQLIDLLGF